MPPLNVGGCPHATAAYTPEGKLLYGYCWYMTTPSNYCDDVCASVPGGSNLANSANSIPTSVFPYDQPTATPFHLFYEDGNPAGFRGACNPGQGKWCFGYAYAQTGTYANAPGCYFGRDSRTTCASYPGQTEGIDGNARIFLCPCLQE